MAALKVKHRFRFYPDAGQAKALDRLFGCVRWVYNRALGLRKEVHKKTAKGWGYCATSAALTQWKRDETLSWLKEPSCVPLQQALRHLDRAFVNFFEKRAKYPAFKRKHGGNQAAEFTARGFVWDAQNHSLSIAKIGRLDVRWSRVIRTQPSSVTITKDAAARYFVTLTVEEERSNLPPAEEPAVGVDLGLKTLAALSTGEQIAPLKVLKRGLGALRKAQRVLSRRVKGSGRRNRQRLKVARLHARVSDARKDYLDKVTTGLVRRFGVIVIEDLNVRGMVRNRRLARSISDAGLATFRRMLTYKCDRRGRQLRVIHRFEPTSKRCSQCGTLNQALTLSDREWSCVCGAVHDRDHNAAVNILAAGHAVTARGGHVRRSTLSRVGRSAR
jgi:putative transposase